MAIMEVSGNRGAFIRCNNSYRDFIWRLLGVRVMDLRPDATGMHHGLGSAFMGAVLRCSRDGNRAIVDEPIDEKTTIHTIIRRVAVNPVTGTAAIAIAVLEITEDGGNTGASFESIIRALSSDYVNLYYVDLETDQFIEYTPDAGHGGLTVERRGADFFGASAKDAQLFIYREDREYFLQCFTKENLVRNMDEHGTFTLTYRLMMNGTPVYVSMKAVRMRADRMHVIVGVSNVDAQMRQKEAIARLQAEQATYSRVKALTRGFICIYTVDPGTGYYTEYSATREYAGLDLDKEGEDFWEVSRRASVRHVYTEDVVKFQTMFTRENVLREIEEKGMFMLHYRMYLEGVPRYIHLQAALIEEQDGPKLIIGVNNVDDLVRRELEYEQRLAQAGPG
jgi:hypothetical protein